MDPLAVFFAFLLGVFFFSGISLVFSLSDKIRQETDPEASSLTSHILKFLLNHENQVAVTIRVGQYASLVLTVGSFYLVSSAMIGSVLSSTLATLIIQAILASLLILFAAEILPRLIFAMGPVSLLKAAAIPLLLLFFLLYPLTAPLSKLSAAFNKNPGSQPFRNEEKGHSFPNSGLNQFISGQKEEQQEHANAGNNELKLFRNALDFSKVKLREIMVPRTEIAALDIRSDFEDLRQKFIETGYSRILFYQDNIDNIIGYIHHSTIFSNPESIHSALKNVITVPETMSASKLLSIFIQQHRSIAVVVDEFGGTSGMVTSEDILEEIFGEIEDEHDTVDWVEKQVSPDEFIFSARIDLDVLNEKYQLGFPVDEGYETLAGFILFHHESIPKVNTVILIGRYNFRILKATNTRIELVRLKVLPERG